MYAVAIKRLGYALSWSFALAVVGMIINIFAGILMCVGRNISMMSTDDGDDKPTGTTRRHTIDKSTGRHPIDKSTGRRRNEDTDFDTTHRKQMRMEEELEFGGDLPRKKPLPESYS
ncbi:hypothetical protein DPMN_046887 [Dreissena polymorpha]|uniref:Uncharacterized protein n=1 Tax=Dreissena polymorpha TaxID=45954 RepID=A0A9D4D7Q9_DREPO|nr:hypothetical protein DPMN_046887 [Dreissena polymorpha]